MSLKNSLKTYVFAYNLMRSQREQFGTFAFCFLLAINTFQMISVLTLIPTQERDLFSSTLNHIIGLFALPSLIEVLRIPAYIVLFALLMLLGAYLVANVACAFFIKKKAKKRIYSWVMIPLPKGDLFYFYKKVMFVPILQLALAEVLRMRNPQVPSQCSTEWCEKTAFGLEVVLLVIALFLYCSLAFITIPCSFEDDAQEESINMALEMIKPFHIALVIALAVADVNLFIVFAFWASYWVIDMIDFLWNGRYTRPKIEHLSSILKGVEFAVFWMFLLPNVLNSSGSNYSFVGFIICPLAIKEIYNLKLLAEKQIITEFSSNLQGIQTLRPLRVHKYLKSLLYQNKAKSTQNHEHSSIALNSLTLTNENPKETAENGSLQYNNLFTKGYFEHDGLQEQNIIDAVEKIYSLISYDKKNKIKLDVTLLWIIFLKDIQKSHVKAFTLLSQMQKSLQYSSFRTKLQVELLDHLIRQQITSSAVEKSVTADSLFTFLGDVEKTKQTIEAYLVKSFEFFILTQSQIVKATDIKKQGAHLLSERAVILKKLKNLIIQNSSHRETIQLFSFFIKDVIEDGFEGKFWELENKRNQQLINNSLLIKEKGWDMTLESFANHIDDGSSCQHVMVISLDPMNFGQLLKLSDRLLEMLDFVGVAPTSLHIDTLEGTFFDRKNLKWIKDQIMEGKDPFSAFIHEDRRIYLKNSNGEFLAFHLFPCLEVYNGVPTIVCYLRTFSEYNHKFLIFNPYKENKIIGIGKGFTWLEGLPFKDKRIQDYLSSFPGDCQQLTPPTLIEGARFHRRNIDREKTSSSVGTDISSPLDHGSQVIDYTVEMLHTTALQRRFGILTIVRSSKKESDKTRTKSPKDGSSVKSKLKSPRKSFWANFGATSASSQVESPDLLTLSLKQKRLVAAEWDLNSPESLAPSDVIKLEVLHKSENHTADDGASSKLIHPRIHHLELHEGKKPGDREPKKSQLSESKSMKIECIQEINSESDSPIHGGRSPVRVIKRKKPFDSAEIKAQTGYAGSTTSSRVGASSNSMRSLINGNRTPAIIKTIYAFGIIIFGMTIVCTLIVYGTLTTQYAKLSDFAAHATFPGFLKVVSASVYMATEMQLALNLGQFSFSSAFSWRISVGQIVGKRIPTFVQTYGENLINFNPESLTNNLNLDNYTIDLGDLPELEIDGSADFYEATAVFMTYAQQMSLVPQYPRLFTSSLVNFMRFFSQPYADNMLDPIREVLVESAYDQYDFVMNLLNYIMVASLLLITTLVFSFGFIFRKFENMETKAFAKLCTVMTKENLAKEINKIITAYESRLGLSLNLSGYAKYNTNWITHEKSKKSRGSVSQSARKIIQGHMSLQKILSALLLVAFALSGSFIMTDVVFRSKTQVLLPYLEDLDKISDGISSYTTVFSTFLRFMNEVTNPNLNETLPDLWNTYQPVLADAMQAHKEMISRFRDFTSRIVDTDIMSAETKSRYQNNTNSSFCATRDQNGTSQMIINMCLTSVQNVASRGLPDTADLIINTVTGLIQQFINSPTKQTAYSILNSVDMYYFNFLTSVVTNSISWLASSEQIDISLYADSLEQETNRLRIICLAYTCLMIVLVWVPTIVYLKKRFRSSRNIFLLFPIGLLNSSEHIKQLFKKW